MQTSNEAGFGESVFALLGPGKQGLQSEQQMPKTSGMNIGERGKSSPLRDTHLKGGECAPKGPFCTSAIWKDRGCSNADLLF